MEALHTTPITNKINDIPFFVDKRMQNNLHKDDSNFIGLRELTAGFVGACALNLIHEGMRTILPHSPRVDTIAMRALDKTLRPVGVHLSYTPLRSLAFAGDVVSNTVYYAAIGGLAKKTPYKNVWGWACLLGVAAGVGAVALPPVMGLGQQPTRNMKVTAPLTVAWYLFGALVTAKALSTKK